MDNDTNNQVAPENEIPQAEDALAKAERERDEYLAGWQRAKADFINYKKDEMKRLEELSRYQTEDLIHEFIGVMDNFELGIAALEKQGNVEKGIYMIKTQIEDILKRRGLTRIQIRAGDAFNPEIAEAIAETDSELAPGSIVEEIEAGYRLHDKVVRPARVKVAK
jgi:molecular chaperone GrpE